MALQQGGILVSADGSQTNQKSLNRRLKAMREAICNAEKLKLVAIKDIASELEHLSSELPEVGLEPAA